MCTRIAATLLTRGHRETRILISKMQGFCAFKDLNLFSKRETRACRTGIVYRTRTRVVNVRLSQKKNEIDWFAPGNQLGIASKSSNSLPNEIADWYCSDARLGNNRELYIYFSSFSFFIVSEVAGYKIRKEGGFFFSLQHLRKELLGPYIK